MRWDLFVNCSSRGRILLSHSKDIGSIPIQFMGKSPLKFLIIIFAATVRLVGQDVALSRQRHGFNPIQFSG